MTLPPPKEFAFTKLPNVVYFGTMGFEDRALAFLKKARSENLHFHTTYGIQYLPFNEKNKEREFLELAKSVSDEVRVLTYNRYSPEEFARQIPALCSAISA